MSVDLTAICALFVVIVLAVGGAKGFTFGKTLRVAWWGVCHPVKAFTSTYDREQDHNGNS